MSMPPLPPPLPPLPAPPLPGSPATAGDRAAEIARVGRLLEQRFDSHGSALGPKRSLVNLDTLLSEDCSLARRLRFNGLSEVVELDGVPLRDEGTTTLLLEIARDYGLEFRPDQVQRLVAKAARTHAHHPVAAYLDGLAWDGQPRIDGYLADYLGAEPSPLHRLLSRRWFVGAVARAMGRGLQPVKLDTCLVLVGAQGAGKSSSFRALASGPWFGDTPLDLRSKDAYLSIRGVWLYELAELASMGSRTADAVKAFLSAPTDRYRPPYARNAVESHRQVVFVGTTNDRTLLTDPTGARRFWPVTVGHIDLKSIGAHRDLLWAEAVVAWRAGERWWLTQQEDALLARGQEPYTEDDPWGATVEMWLAHPTNLARAREGYRMVELLAEVISMPVERQQRRDEMRLSKQLQRLGWTKGRRRTGQGRHNVWFPPSS